MSFMDTFRKSPTLEDIAGIVAKEQVSNPHSKVDPEEEEEEEEGGIDSRFDSDLELTSDDSEKDEKNASNKLPVKKKIPRINNRIRTYSNNSNTSNSLKKKTSVPQIDSEDDEEENLSDLSDFSLDSPKDDLKSKKKNIQLTAEKVQVRPISPPIKLPRELKKLRPSSVELKKSSENSISQQQPLTPVSRQTFSTSRNIQLLQDELKKSQQKNETEKIDKKQEEKKSQQKNDIIDKNKKDQEIQKIEKKTLPRFEKKQEIIPVSTSTLVEEFALYSHVFSSSSWETIYFLRGITDNGQKWSAEYMPINPGQGRLFHVKNELHPDQILPESHIPIILSGECYASISIELSWFPIGNHQYVSVIPEDAPQGFCTIHFSCFPNLVQENNGEKKAFYTCTINATEKDKKENLIQVKNLSRKKSIALINNQVVFQVQAFNGLNVFHSSSPLLKNYDFKQIWYLDMHVAHLQQDLSKYRLYWNARVSTLVNHIAFGLKH